MTKVVNVAFAFMLLATVKTLGQIPAIIEKNGRHALMVDGKPFLILGGQAHNSSGWPAMLPQVWHSVQYMNLNTLEIPVYREQVDCITSHADRKMKMIPGSINIASLRDLYCTFCSMLPIFSP